MPYWSTGLILPVYGLLRVTVSAPHVVPASFFMRASRSKLFRRLFLFVCLFSSFAHCVYLSVAILLLPTKTPCLSCQDHHIPSRKRDIRPLHRLVGLVVKASASRAEDPGLDSRSCRGDIFGSSHTSDFKIGTPVATLPGAWNCRVSTGLARCQYTVTGWGRKVDLHLLSQCLSKQIVWADPPLRYTRMLLGRKTTNK